MTAIANQPGSNTVDLNGNITNGSAVRRDNGDDINHIEAQSGRVNSKWRASIEKLSPIWFTIVMTTGVLGILYQNQPYSFSGLKIISTIMYVFAIVLFIALIIPTIVRWTWFRQAAMRNTRGNLDEIAMLAAMPIAWLEITALTALITSNSYWGHHAFSLVAYAMWWFGMAWMVVTCIGVCIGIFANNITSDRTMSTTLFIPAVGVSTAAVSGALICRYAYDLSARLAVPVLIMSYFLNGLAIFISLELYTVYFHHLMTSGWPEGQSLPSLMILVGPFGQTASALLLAGSAASTRMDFGDYMKGTFLDTSAGMTVASSGTLIALLLLGHDFFWIVVAFHGVIKGFYYHQHEYSLVWWATIFPLATTTTAFISLSIVMDSPTFRVLAAGFTIFLTIVYIVNLAFTVWYVIFQDLLIKSDVEETLDDKRD